MIKIKLHNNPTKNQQKLQNAPSRVSPFLHRTRCVSELYVNSSRNSGFFCDNSLKTSPSARWVCIIYKQQHPTSFYTCSNALPGKSASKSDRSETQNLNPMEVDFSWLHHIPKQHHHVLLYMQRCNCLANLHPNLTDLKHKIRIRRREVDFSWLSHIPNQHPHELCL